MANKKLHPSVEQFKQFVKANPNIIKEVRNGNSTWQELYEDWYLLGEENERWSSLVTNVQKQKEETPKQEESGSNNAMMQTVVNSIKNMDQNQLQGYIANISQALGAIQGVVSQFGGGGTTTTTKSSGSSASKPSGPFSFRKD